MKGLSHLFVGLLLIVPFFVKAQTPFNVAVESGITDKLKDGAVQHVIGNRKDGLCILIYDKSGTLYVKKVAKDNTVIQTQMLPNELKDKVYAGDFAPGNKHFFIECKIENKARVYTAYELDVAQGKVKGSGKSLCSYASMDYDAPNVYVSKDNKKLWVIETHYGIRENGDANIVCTEFDENLRQVKKFTANLGIERKLIRPDNYETDDENLYFLFKKYNNKRNEAASYKPNYTHEVVNLSGAKPESIASIESDDKFIPQLLMRSYKKDLVIAGYYSKDEYEHMNGLFSCRINNGKQGENVFIEFKEELTTKYGEKCPYPVHKKNMGAHVDDMHLQSVEVDQADGGIFVTGQSYINSVSGQGNSWSDAKNIYTAKINADGTLGYSTKIPYHRIGNYSLGLFQSKTYSTLRAGGRQFFLIDESKNVRDDGEPEALRASTTGVDVAYVIDVTGNIKKYLTSLSSGASEGYKSYNVRPNQQIDSDEFVFFTRSDVVFWKLE